MTERVLDYAATICILVSTTCLLIYVPRMAAWFSAFRPQKRLFNDKLNKIAVIIPAKDEGRIIDDIFISLMRQTYPREFFDIHVVVKNPQDITIEKTKKIGGYFYVAPCQTCKGDALDVCMKSILKNHPDTYDAFYIADADCLLQNDCLEEMNHAMVSGAMIIQSRKLVKNYLSKDSSANSLASACNGLIWTMIDSLGNKYKAEHNITGMTIGTGLLLTSEFVKMLGGWPYRSTLTEDMELMNDCAVHGYSTFYYSYSVIYVEESTSLKVTNMRRTRWMTGLIDSKAIYNQQLVSQTLHKGNMKNIYFVTALWPVFYYIGNLLLFSVFSFMTGSWLLLNNRGLALKAYALCGESILAIYGSFLVLTAICMLADWKHIRLPFMKKLALFFVHPFFYMGYIPIVAGAFLNRNTQSWDAIERMEFSDEYELMGDVQEDEYYEMGCIKKNSGM